MYLQGKNGQLVNMDIDCDGALGKGDGSCQSSTDTQSQTTFQDTVRGYNKGVKNLNAYVHSYVVLGNDGKKNGYIEFKPEQYGVEPLSVVAVVCGNQMVSVSALAALDVKLMQYNQFYGVWGDTNGDDGPPLVGEVSDSLGQACYGKAVNGNAAHDDNDVLYIAFTGSDAVPGANGAKWDAKSFSQFESSLGSLGDTLIQRISGEGSGNSTLGSPPSSTASTKPPLSKTSYLSSARPTATSSSHCSWKGHCLGAKCSSEDDCDGNLVCKSKKCA